MIEKPVIGTPYRLMPILWAAALLLSTCAGAAAPTLTPTSLPAPTPEVAIVTIERDPDVPELPFPDNPDPLQCGIPVQWGSSNNRAWLNGLYEGEMVQPEVLLCQLLPAKAGSLSLALRH